NWRVVAYIDDGATEDQRNALLDMWTGKLGGPVKDLAGLIGELLGVEQVPITFDVEGGKGRLQIGDAITAELAPYKGLTGKETTLPLVAMFNQLTRARADSRRLMGLLLIGYLSVWLLFGMLVYLGDTMLHEAVASSSWIAEHIWAVGALTLLLAGAYQFTPLKY